MNADGASVVLAPTPELAVGHERDAHLSADTRAALDAAVPTRTAQAYNAAWSRFATWCHGELRNALPATPETLTEYVRALTTNPTERGELPAASSIEQAIAVIRSKHSAEGYEKQPSTVHALRLLKRYRRDQAEDGRRTKKASPITARVLRRLVAATPDTTRGTRNRFLLVCGFYMMARRSELAALNVSDVRVDGDDLVVLVRASKTDQEARGREVRLPRSRRPEICPIQLHGAWMAELTEASVLGGRLFRSVDRHGNIGESLSGDAINRIVRELAEKVDFDLPAEVSTYTAHSLRAGGATQARQNGAHMAAIAEHGRWSPRSPVIYGYIRDEDARSSNVMHGSDQ